MSVRNTTAALLSSFAILASLGSGVVAQEAEPVAPVESEMAAPAAADFDQSLIDAFAAVFIQVVDIGMAAEQQMQAAATDEERIAVQMQAQEQMDSIIESAEGITLEEYNAILTAAQADPVFAEQVQNTVDAAL